MAQVRPLRERPIRDGHTLIFPLSQAMFRDILVRIRSTAHKSPLIAVGCIGNTLSVLYLER